MFLSIIIPTLNECDNLKELLPLLINNSQRHLVEVIVVDAGMCSESKEMCRSLGVQYVLSEKKGRAVQLNLGAKKATGSILYFVHADTRPPKSFVADIREALSRGFQSGCYRFKFDSNKLLLKFNSYCTRFNRLMMRGGDQTLFITKELFNELNGFDEYYTVMEEYPLIGKLMKLKTFKIMDGDVLVSARKYEQNSYLRVNFANFIAFMMFRAKSHPDKIRSTYLSLIKHPVEK